MKSALVLISCWAALSHAAVLSTPAMKRGPASVRLTQARTPSEPLMLHVEAFSEEHNLRLFPASSLLSADFRMQTIVNIDGEQQIQDIEDESQEAGLFHDPDTGAVVRVEGESVEGLITPTLSIYSAQNGQHEAVQHSASILSRNDYLEVPTGIKNDTSSSSLLSRNDYLEVPTGIKNDTSSSKSTRGVLSVSPEMYIVVDSTIANALGSNNKVKNYLSVFWNGVTQRFATMDDPKVNLVLSGALIIRTEADESFITNNGLLNKYIHGENTLNSVSDWLFTKKDQLPAYDMAYLMTGKDMADVENGMIQKGLAGIAWKGAACVSSSYQKRSYKTGMGEDMGTYYSGVMTAAHEVAHNLGSPHDGSGDAAACSWDDGYIMSYIGGKSNKLFFSPCSQSEMKSYMSSSDASCLKTTSVGVKIPLSSTLPGEKVTMAEQCQKQTGQNNAYASKSVSEDSLCVQLVCQWQVTEGNTIWTYTQSTGRPAAEGSACPSGGRCTNGKCQ